MEETVLHFYKKRLIYCRNELDIIITNYNKQENTDLSSEELRNFMQKINYYFSLMTTLSEKIETFPNENAILIASSVKNILNIFLKVVKTKRN